MAKGLIPCIVASDNIITILLLRFRAITDHGSLVSFQATKNTHFKSSGLSQKQNTVVHPDLVIQLKY